jgi:hypothetical protein
MKDPGYYVELKDGRKGILMRKDIIPNGKQVIKLVDDKFKPILDDKKKPKVGISLFSDLKIIGYIN